MNKIKIDIMNQEIMVLLSTYNGEKYLKEQLDSINKRITELEKEEKK